MVLKTDGQNIIGILQAGGQSTRFGSPKAFAKYDGKSLFNYSLKALRESTDEALIVSHPTLTKRFMKETNVKIIQDISRYQGFGPLSGLYSSMCHQKAEWYVQLACDMPEITSQTLKKLIKTTDQYKGDAIIPRALGYRQPLAGLYHYRIMPYLEDLLEQKRLKIKFLLDQINTQYINVSDLGIDENEFININTKEDFLQLKEERQ